MRHTKQISLNFGGAIFVTFDQEDEEFESQLGGILLDNSGTQ